MPAGFAKEFAEFNFGTWNMQGASFQNDQSKYSTGVTALMTGFYNGNRIFIGEPGMPRVPMEPTDVLVLTEAGNVPGSDS